VVASGAREATAIALGFEGTTCFFTVGIVGEVEVPTARSAATEEVARGVIWIVVVVAAAVLVAAPATAPPFPLPSLLDADVVVCAGLPNDFRIENQLLPEIATTA